MQDRTRRAAERAKVLEMKQKAKRGRLAAGVAAWANAVIANAADDRARIDQIRAEAHARRCGSLLSGGERSVREWDR